MVSEEGVEFDRRCVAILPADEQAKEAKCRPIAERRSDSGPKDKRRSARRDRDKILYSQAWRRLAGITQVVSPDGEDLVLHNRLTHSEKVAQVAWSIGAFLIEGSSSQEKAIIAGLGGIDLDMIEAAAWAHDLGHPPFGHVGEYILDEEAIKNGVIDGFEGNAQSFRILTRLARWHQYEAGLTLTAGTLCAVLKYPWVRGASHFDTHEDVESAPEELLEASRRRSEGENGLYWKKFGAYNTEADLLAEARAWLPAPYQQEGGRFAQSLEASVMDIADDITYAIHDLEDFVASGLIRLDEIQHEFQAGDRRVKDSFYDRIKDDPKRKYPDYFDAVSMGKASEWFEVFFGGMHSSTSSGQAEGSLEKTLAKIVGDLLDYFIPAIVVSETQAWKNGPFVTLNRDAWHRLHLLKGFTMEFVVNTSSVTAQQISSRRLIKSITGDVFDWAGGPNYGSLPIELRSRLMLHRRDDRTETVAHQHATCEQRLVVDYIANLTDHSARSLYARFNPSGNDQIFGMAML